MSAAETETGGVFHNAQTAIILRRLLEALGHPQPATPLRTDNTVSNSFVHSNIKQRRSKTWDMRWNWLCDKQTHKEVEVYWGPGKDQRADYFTKHHPPSHHIVSRPQYILQGHNASQNIIPTGLTLCSRIRSRCARVCSNLVSQPVIHTGSGFTSDLSDVRQTRLSVVRPSSVSHPSGSRFVELHPSVNQ